MKQNRELTADFSKFANLNTASVSDYEMITSTLARVVIAYTGDDSEGVKEALSTKLNGLARPVEGSFVTISKGVAVGFVYANQERRVMEKTPEEAKVYRKISANLVMDQTDSSLWELREGANGEYLCRQGTENLSELVEAAKSYGRNTKMGRVQFAAASFQEFASFVNTETQELDHGFVISAAGLNYEIMSVNARQAVKVDHRCIVNVANVGDSFKEAAPRGLKAVTAGSDRKSVVDYWTKVYDFGDQAGNDYVAELVKQIDMHNFL